jgi:cytidine diphosphoramidate kinase
VLTAPPAPAADRATGAVVWITGLSGAGKTTVAGLVTDALRAGGRPPVLLDGDRIRAALPVPAGYDAPARRALAGCYGRLALELAGQGHLVLCATVSMFHAVHAWNRRHLPGYLEVWLRAPLPELRGRDTRGVYAGASAVGAGIEPELPRAADLVIDNHPPVSAAAAAAAVLALIRDRGRADRSLTEAR